jgi:putative redox protein
MALVTPRPVLVVHGTDDESVPAFDGRVLADAHGRAELRLVGGASHALRHDPRAMAVLLGWLDRQRATAPVPRAR